MQASELAHLLHTLFACETSEQQRLEALHEISDMNASVELSGDRLRVVFGGSTGLCLGEYEITVRKTSRAIVDVDDAGSPYAPSVVAVRDAILRSVREQQRVTISHRGMLESSLLHLCEEYERTDTPEGSVFSGMWEGGYEWSVLVPACRWCCVVDTEYRVNTPEEIATVRAALDDAGERCAYVWVGSSEGSDDSEQTEQLIWAASAIPEQEARP